MTEIMPVPRILILLSYQQGASYPFSIEIDTAYANNAFPKQL